jgi:hypothetical protein
MYSHLSQGPNAGTITPADYLTNDFGEVVPISTSQVETRVNTVVVLPPTQAAFPQVVVNSSPKVGPVLIGPMRLLTAGWHFKSKRTLFYHYSI